MSMLCVQLFWMRAASMASRSSRGAKWIEGISNENDDDDVPKFAGKAVSSFATCGLLQPSTAPTNNSRPEETNEARTLIDAPPLGQAVAWTLLPFVLAVSASIAQYAERRS